MPAHSDRSRSPEWQPGSAKIPATSRDIARQIKHPLPKATDGTANAIQDILKEHRDVLQAAQQAHESTGSTVRRGRIIGPTDTALEASAPIVSSKDDPTLFTPGMVPDAPILHVQRVNSSDLYCMAYDQNGEPQQKMIRTRNRPEEQGLRDILDISVKQDSSSSVTRFSFGDLLSQLPPENPSIQTTIDAQGTHTASFVTDDGTRVTYFRDPHGNEIIL